MELGYTFSFQNVMLVLPETIVVICLLVVILLEVSLSSPTWLDRISFIGLFASILVLLWQWRYGSVWLGLFQPDGISIAFRALVALCAALCIPLSTEYVQRSGMAMAEFLIFLLGATIGGMFLCGANDLVTAFVALECLSLCSYLLAGYAKRDVRSNEAALKYLLMGGTSSAVLAYGFSWLYGLSGGEIRFQALATGVESHLSQPLAVWIALACVLAGMSFKLSAVPFHQWAPDVYEGAPTPVVAFLSVGSKAAGLAFLLRVLSIVFPSLQVQWHPLVEGLAVLSMVFGNLIAVTQTSIKRMLAYSSISQAGYMMIGLVADNPDGQASMTVYMLTYLFMNLGAFACVVVFGLRTGTDQIRDYTGLCLRDPWLTGCLSVCLLSLGGIPPLAGFFAKLYLFWSGWKSGLYLTVLIALLTSVVSFYFYLRVVKVMLTKQAKEMSPYVRDYVAPSVSWLTPNPITLSVTLCVFVSMLLGIVMNPLIIAVQQIVLASPALVL